MNDPRHELGGQANGSRGHFGHDRLLADLKAWLDGELTPPRVWAVRAHLWFCPTCREEVKWLQRLGEDMRDLEKAVPSPRLRARILAALPDTPPGIPAGQRPAIRWSWSAAAPALAAFGAVACTAAAIIILYPKRPANSAVAGPAMETVRATPRQIKAAPSEPQQGSEPVPAFPIDPTPDRNNVYADRMTQRWLEHNEHLEAQELAKNRANFAKMVAAVHAERGPRETADPVRLALEVTDVDRASSRLEAWAKSAGGTVSGNPHEATPAAIVAPLINTSEPPSRPVAVTGNGGEHILTLRVPQAKVASMEAVLLQIGALRASAAKPAKTSGLPKPKIPASAQPSGAGAQAITRTDTGGQTGRPATAAGAGSAGYANQAVGRDGDAVMITLQILLNNREAPSP